VEVGAAFTQILTVAVQVVLVVEQVVQLQLVQQEQQTLVVAVAVTEELMLVRVQSHMLAVVVVLE
jgi:hypothetical protein